MVARENWFEVFGVFVVCLLFELDSGFTVNNPLLFLVLIYDTLKFVMCLNKVL